MVFDSKPPSSTKGADDGIGYRSSGKVLSAGDNVHADDNDKQRIWHTCHRNLEITVDKLSQQVQPLPVPIRLLLRFFVIKSEEGSSRGR